MSTNSNRVTGGIMVFAGVIVSFIASAWPAQSEYLWGITVGLLACGVVLGQLGMMQDIQVGIDDLKKLLPTIAEKVEAMEKDLTDLKARLTGQFREQA